ncbi:MAG: DNA topoisomerase IV subunit A, partial [Rhodobacteraceae bacterium]|nr:DNA topoisomerase IV subunit A [Paracoccaceae bacterium]
GEPLRLMVDLPNDVAIVDLFLHVPGRRLILASTVGDGFLVPEEEVLAQTRSGKQALNVKDPVRAALCRPLVGDHVAVVSQNGKLLIFPASELPEMSRGKGVRLQKYNMARGRQGSLELDGGLADLTSFDLAQGLSWQTPNGQTRREPDVAQWLGKRAGVGRQVPRGFPKDRRFT